MTSSAAKLCDSALPTLSGAFDRSARAMMTSWSVKRAIVVALIGIAPEKFALTATAR
jgi:hypothetical protein